MNNFSSFEELRNNALRSTRVGRSEPYDFDDESDPCCSSNMIVSNDYKLNTSISMMKV